MNWSIDRLKDHRKASRLSSVVRQPHSMECQSLLVLVTKLCPKSITVVDGYQVMSIDSINRQPHSFYGVSIMISGKLPRYVN